MSTQAPQRTVRLGVIVGSTRPGRRGTAVAGWVEQVAAQHTAVLAGEATVDVIDLAAYELPVLDEPVPAMFADYRHSHTKRWSTVINSCDAFVFATPEYNHSFSAALKNAIDFLYAEWNDKAVGIVSYGVHGGSRAADHLRLVLAEVRAAAVPTQVSLSVFADFDFTGFDMTDPTSPGVLSPGEHQAPTLTTMLDEVIAWSRALTQQHEATANAPETSAPHATAPEHGG